jgi:hypothetical protein
MIPQVYPKPIAFYQSPHFSGNRAQAVYPDADAGKITLIDADEQLHGRIVSQLQTVKFRRSGTLSGQYVIMANGFVAIDRNGAPIKLNSDSDDDWSNKSMHSQLEQYCSSEHFAHFRDSVLASWERLDPLAGLPIIAESHAAANYYHFSIRFLPRVRHFADAATTLIGVPVTHLQRPFQKDLISMTFGHRRIVPISDMRKVEDPVLMYEPFSSDAMQWLRAQVGLVARKGTRRIYIARRSSIVGRHHGGILDSAEFDRFLASYGFETIDFGSGEISICQQIAMLDGAAIVLSAHGANLTNIAFAEEGMPVVEILPHYWCFCSHMQIALAASLPYFGVVCHEIDSNQQMVVDLASLSSAVEQALAVALR